MDLEELVHAHKQLSLQIEDLEAKRKALGTVILEQMQDSVVHLSNYVVRRYSRLSIKLSLEEARLLDMVKMQEVVDRERIKTFHKAGHPIPGVTECHHIQVCQRLETAEKNMKLQD